MQDILDQPLEEQNSSVWATVSVVVGLVGMFAMVYFSYQIISSLNAAPNSGQRGINAVGDKIVMGGYVMVGIYIVSIACLIMSYLKEKMTAARVIATVGHVLVLLTLAYRIVQKYL